MLVYTCSYKSLCLRKLRIVPLYLYREQVNLYKAAMLYGYSSPEQTNL